MCLSLLRASELVKVNTNPPSEMEITKEIRFLKRHKATRPGLLSPSSMEDGGDVLTVELTNSRTSLCLRNS